MEGQPQEKEAGPDGGGSKRRKLEEEDQGSSTTTSNNASTSTDAPLPAVEAAARGGHIRGDFPKYYEFHSTTPRIQALLGDAEAARVLRAVSAGQQGPMLVSDWGSNAGDLTLELARQLRDALCQGLGQGATVAALGLELNAGLVERARALAAQQTQQQGGNGESSLELEFEALDVVAEEERVRALLGVFVRKHRPTVVEAEADLRVDILTVFSTTMWVHLAHGDEGLKRMLRTAAGLARCLVVEPQDNKSYRNARKRLRRMDVDPSEHFRDYLDPALRTSEGLAAFLLSSQECGPAARFTRWRNVGKSSSWGRDLLLFWREEEAGTDGDEDGGGTTTGEAK